MPRRPRLEMPGVSLHLTHRGVNRAATFLDDEDFQLYLSCLAEAFTERGIALHAYVLMTNHVHLLLTSPAPGLLSTAMCQVGRRYVPAFNRRHGRTGTLWEGRYKASLVDSESHVLHCHRYIELNPVRARMTDDPTTFPWSSCASHCGLRQDAMLSPHPEYTALAATPEARAEAYRQLLLKRPRFSESLRSRGLG